MRDPLLTGYEFVSDDSMIGQTVAIVNNNARKIYLSPAMLSLLKSDPILMAKHLKVRNESTLENLF